VAHPFSKSSSIASARKQACGSIPGLTISRALKEQLGQVAAGLFKGHHLRVYANLDSLRGVGNSLPQEIPATRLSFLLYFFNVIIISVYITSLGAGSCG
jgi:hypothetical protein